SMLFLFCKDPATPEIYTLSLHDALPIYIEVGERGIVGVAELTAQILCLGVEVAAMVLDEVVAEQHRQLERVRELVGTVAPGRVRSEEHTSELQSRGHLVCRLLLEKKKKK